MTESSRLPKLEQAAEFTETFPLMGDTYISMTERGGAEVVLKLHTNAGVFDLSNLVAGTTFCIGDKTQVDTRRRIVYLEYTTFHNPRGICAVLHELGHIAVRDDQTSSDYAARVQEARAQDFNEASTEQVRTILADERNAWARALVFMRQLETAYPDVRVRELFSDGAELRGWIRLMGLSSYECDMAEKEGISPTAILSMYENVGRWLEGAVADMFDDEMRGAQALKRRIEGLE